jgi:CheY-like chemotaxis protein
MLTKDEVNRLLEPQGPQSDMDKIKILVVEDDHTTQLLYNKGFFNQVFDIKMVASGRDAILVYDAWHPDIIMLDIYLPEMTGYQVLKAIRTTIKDRKTTIVMATSLSGSEDIKSCMKLGVEGYIVKPFQCMDIGLKILSYYEKKEPEKARKAEALCMEIVKGYQVKSLFGEDQPNVSKDMKGSSNGASDTEIGESGEKAEGETPVEK